MSFITKLKCIIGLHDWLYRLDGPDNSERICRRCYKKEKVSPRFYEAYQKQVYGD